MSKTSLMDMPDLAMTKILEKCDLLSILILRKVCHGMRNFIDDSKPEQSLSKIEISAPTKFSLENQVEFVVHGGTRYPKSRTMEFIYGRDNKGCKTTWLGNNENKCKIVNEKSPSAIFIMDLQTILKLRLPVLREFKIDGPLGEFLVRDITECLKNNPVRARKVEICGDDQSHFMALLSNFSCIEKIFLRNRTKYTNYEYPSVQTNQIVKLDQWKGAKEFCCFGLKILTPIQNFAHFDYISIRYKKFSADSLKFLKELFLNPNSDSKQFVFRGTKIEKDVLIEVFGEPSENDRYRLNMTWFISKSSDSMLMVHVNKNELFLKIF